MDKNELVDQMIEQCLEQDKSAYEEIRSEFKKRVANPGAKPGAGRIKELESIWGDLNTRRKATSSEAIHAMLKDIDEAELIESKKGNSKEKG